VWCSFVGNSRKPLSRLINEFCSNCQRVIVLHITGAASRATGKLLECNDTPLLKADRMKRFPAVAKLLYLAKRARPDILRTVAYLCTRVTCFTELVYLHIYTPCSNGSMMRFSRELCGVPLLEIAGNHCLA
jgi:hypothetical protein